MKTRNGLFADVLESDWNNWHCQVANRASTVCDLEKYGIVLTGEERKGIEDTLGQLRMAVTLYYLSLINLDDSSCIPVTHSVVSRECRLHRE